jgi:hypothetical protein
LPDEYPQFSDVCTLLGTEEVTVESIKAFCEKHNLPCRAIDMKGIGNEVYVWELLRQIAERTYHEKEMEYLKVMATDNTQAKVKQAAEEAWNEASRFYNTQD